MHILRSYSTTAERFINISSPFKEKLPLQESMYGQTNGHTGWFLYTKTNFIREGYNNTKWKLERNFIINANCFKQDLSDSDSIMACI